MTIDIKELFHGRTETVSNTAPRLETAYVVTGAVNEDEVKVIASATIPTQIGNMKRQSIVLDERVNETTWNVRATYEKPELDEQKPQRTFDTTGGTQHITQSIATPGRYGENAPDLGGAIAFDGEKVQGVDITSPVFNLSETHYKKKDDVTNAYMGTIFRLTGKVNSNHFRGFQPGEALFLGASAQQRGDEDWEINFRFAALPNRNAFMIGTIAIAEKKGWDYLWVRYGQEVDDDSKSLIQKPVAVYVEQVYETGDFTALGLGEWQ